MEFCVERVCSHQEGRILVRQALLVPRVLLLLVQHPDLRSIGLLSRRSLSIARGRAVPRQSVVGALRTLELLLRHLEQARTSLAALVPANFAQRTAVEE